MSLPVLILRAPSSWVTVELYAHMAVWTLSSHPSMHLLQSPDNNRTSHGVENVTAPGPALTSIECISVPLASCHLVQFQLLSG